MTPLPPPQLTGVVLAGGRSTRMGADKAVLRLGGRRLVDLAVEMLDGICSEVVVSAGTRVIPDLGVPQLHDSAEHGPLGGIVAGLAHASTALVAVVAVDMPEADAGVLVDLARRWDGEVAILPRAAGRVEPLHGVYATAWRDRLQAAVEAGQRSPTRLLEGLGAVVVDVTDGGFARNLNLPSDLPAAEPSG